MILSPILYLIGTYKSKKKKIKNIISGCGLPHPLLSHGATKNAKVISEKSIFFVNISSSNQYDHFLKLE